MLKPIQTFTSPTELYGNLQKTAIIDVGSNSFRLIVITYLPGFYFHMTDEVREAVRLVQGLGQTGQLSEAAMNRALEALHLYRQFCDAQGITDIRAVATSAVREATNRKEFLMRVRQRTGIEVRVLSGMEEAYYSFLAAVNTMTITDGYVMDIGGGSLQITRVAERQSKDAASFTLGAVRTTEDFIPNAPTDKEDVLKLRRHVRKLLEPYGWYKHRSGLALNGIGGSMRNLARLIQKSHDYPLDELHGYEVSLDDIQEMARKLEPMTVEQRRAVPGMKPDRADIALAAAVVIGEIMKIGGFEHLTICAYGLREGVFFERFLVDNAPPVFEDVRTASVMNIAHFYRFQEQHCEHVAHLALGMFDQMQDKYCTPAERELLWAACMLHDIGMNIDYNDHHRHSYYLIMNSGLPGFTHRELALIALAARFHRKGDPDLGELGQILDSGDQQRLLRITAFLRLAEQLDRSRDGAVKDVRLRIENGPNGRQAILECISPVDITVSLWSAYNHTDIFMKAFGTPLRIVHVEA